MRSNRFEAWKHWRWSNKDKYTVPGKPRVLPGTPAAATALSAGDRVLEIDGTPVVERGCSKLDKPEKARQRLGIQRGDTIEQIDLELFELIE